MLRQNCKIIIKPYSVLAPGIFLHFSIDLEREGWGGGGGGNLLVPNKLNGKLFALGIQSGLLSRRQTLVM